MNAIDTNQNLEPALLNTLIDTLMASSSPQDLCRRFVHSDLLRGRARGAAIYVLSSSSELLELASYGVKSGHDSANISLWSDHPYSATLRMGKIENFGANGSEIKACTCLPLYLDSIPFGLVVISLVEESEDEPLGPDAFEIVSKLCAYFLKILGVPKNSSAQRLEGGEIGQLTNRQLEIIGHMAEGLTNAEIGLKILMSESTVRQETIRIYRALGVNSRQLAVAKARAIGLLQ